MTLRELAHIKRWHVQHRHHHPVEFQAWDVMLTAWLIGFMGAPAALLVDAPEAIVVCALLFFAPGAYVHCRERRHRAGRLRCDWLDALHAATRAERL
jgi:hypothetical protein